MHKRKYVYSRPTLLFHGQTDLLAKAFAGSCNWYSCKPQAKNLSQAHTVSAMCHIYCTDEV